MDFMIGALNCSTISTELLNMTLSENCSESDGSRCQTASKYALGILMNWPRSDEYWNEMDTGVVPKLNVTGSDIFAPGMPPSVAFDTFISWVRSSVVTKSPILAK